MEKYIAAIFTCSGLIIIALSGIGKILMVGLPDFYPAHETSSYIPLITFIVGIMILLIGLSFYIKKVLFYDLSKNNN
ncbi:hypothetical protein [Lentibacillus cibarius]|uniref:DUF3955 domain-containing protein n=1 Tax=Lentibacillus cibarius TaxID=2583219 RepID=A0A5S3QFF5_9BACI|nr:hypothetical protein [Lentibacillus cibarius]TMN18812.1 hypothetical protein FFL34_17835 [Lentibacillus cibarius]TMN18840.1 hypothetical protein FFL34_18005 [Lentibacillus cibarius]